MAGSNFPKETPYSVEVDLGVIKKCAIGKLIVTYCGNEGKKDDESLVVSLRTLLQNVITKLDTETEQTWRNAEIIVYDQQGNDFCIKSGDAENKFVVQLDGKDEINISCTQRKEDEGTIAWLTSCFRFTSNKDNKQRKAIEQSKPDHEIGETGSQLNDDDIQDASTQRYFTQNENEWVVIDLPPQPATVQNGTEV